MERPRLSLDTQGFVVHNLLTMNKKKTSSLSRSKPSKIKKVGSTSGLSGRRKLTTSGKRKKPVKPKGRLRYK